jgi:hypothetical protein
LAATFRHDEQGLRSLCRELVRLGVELAAVERPDGLLVERLLDAGLRVLALHPNQGRVLSLRAATSACAPPSAPSRDTTRHWHPWAQDLYAAARAGGHDHPRALRTLGRAWCRIVWQCWQDGVPYDPARHRALQHHITVTIPTPSGPVPDPAATPADGRRRRHPMGGPQGRARSA